MENPDGENQIDYVTNNTTRPALNDNVERVASICVSLVIMPRRSTAPVAGPSTQIKQEGVTVKTEKVKKEKGIGKRREQTPEQEEDQPKEEGDEEDGSQRNDAEDYNEQEGESPRGNKRRRVNGRGQSAVEDDEGGSQPRPSLPQIKTLPRGEDGQVSYSLLYAYPQFFSVTFLDPSFVSNFATSLPTIMLSSHRGRI